MADPTAIPQTAFLQSDGTISHAWLRYMDMNWRKLGGYTRNAPINSENITGILASISQAANAQLNATNFCTVDSIDNGTSATIRVYGSGGVGTTWTRQVGSTIFGPYPALSQAGLSYSTVYYVMYNPASPAFVVTTNFVDILPDGYFWCGQLTTVASGGAGGTTGGGGSGGGHSGNCFSGNTKVNTPDGVKQFYTMPTLATVKTRHGWREADLIISPYEGFLYDMGNGELVTPKHPFYRDGLWVPADELFSEKQSFSGHVYNFHVRTDKEDERNFELANGNMVHNLSVI